MIDLPGPSDYIPDITKDIDMNKDSGEKKPFGVNVKRFDTKVSENGVPGAGTYKLPNSC